MLDKTAEVVLVGSRKTKETYSVSESRRQAGNLTVQVQLGLAQPERDVESGIDGQRDNHFDETASLAEVGGFAPDDGLSGRMQLSGDVTFHTWPASALIDSRGKERVGPGFRQRKIPERFVWAQVQ